MATGDSGMVKVGARTDSQGRGGAMWRSRAPPPCGEVLTVGRSVEAQVVVGGADLDIVAAGAHIHGMEPAALGPVSYTHLTLPTNREV